ncbi:BlaI/MecI/CopY family transcriptional regulator [Adhaeribacter radiodurans]|uniref:BlaI/MecI/CopY family transcriptional regulator n=1 Tax=Adhaeribacter radiodurans TaxID=2745197 RepID=A0A7L7LD35_9BACT|nr:BlaI/MecI/CopY family transcriptional regulator [Adhaeribacter radiodurans]QMU30762.1 BlaI/MecI/CopY family transcriptional regulator [Adhaeribacter radiodurans]
MADNQPVKPTETELEILQILWEHGPNTVRFVNEKQNESKEVGYTTTLKIMQIMAEKNFIAADKSSRSHVYQVLLPEEDTQKQLLDKFLDTAFRGSASKLVLQALGNHRTSEDELNQIRHLLDKLEGGQK